ncbi:hypothetical protein AVEN_45887-1 [Araneus ventricosus]|uniref:DUF4817 domain-containing protein n=1 Tax=Araneus ventricosus TaxID=182803 RepID=A0A4Y2JY45_ARAVE|nr:hypothetical protein AVEN_45887-1 [Araneus ventricosus]
MVAMYSVRDYCDMYLMYDRCNGNALRTAREYARRNPSRRPPDGNVIRRLDDRLRNTGSVLPTANLHDTERPRSGLTVAQADAILQRVEETPEQQQSTDNGFIAHILWTDESRFTRDGVFNHHNSHVWSQVNPHAIRPQKHQERWSLNVWAGILGDRLLGPYLLPERLSGQSHLVFLNEVLTEFLDDIPLAAIQGLWFQHDGAPEHFCAPVRAWLDMEYPGSWIGRGGPVLRPPRSPYLTPLDFFLWGHLKELVYRDVVTTQMDFVARLHAACTSVDPAMLQRVMTAIPRRAQACLDMHGGHFEHLL